MDEIYIQQILQGDINAYRFLVEKYKDMVYTIAYGITQADLLAEEVAQDTFLKAFQNLEKFKKKAKFSTWLYRIAVNESLRKVRKKSLNFEHLDDLQLSDQKIELKPEAIEQMHQVEQREMICNILNALNTNESLVLRLYYLEELSIEEISKIMRLSPSNAKVILYRARKSFAARMNKSVSYIY
jgi:RNA polymerase sigma-70 factor (ECF subfamily)